MTGKLSTLSIATVAALAMSAAVASAAQAAVFTVEGGGEATLTLVAEGTQVFKAGFGKANCKEVSGEAALGGESSELTTENLSYTNCSASIGFPATVSVPSGCHSDYTAAPVTFSGVGHRTCNSLITWIILLIYAFGDEEYSEEPICTIYGQAPSTFEIVYHNIVREGVMAVEMTESESELQITYEGPLCGEGEETALLTGSSVLVGENAFSELIGVTVE